MLLKFALGDSGASLPAGVAEGDPLPPEDRAIDLPRLSLDAVYRSQAPRLLRFFARRSHAGDAEDLVSDSFVRLAAAPALQRGDVDNPEGYLQEVAKNVLRNRARAAFHRSIVDFDPDIDRASDRHDPMAALEARDMLARMQAALSKLSPKTHAIFVAHRLEGATYSELAAEHGLSVKGVEWHMSKAIAHLHKAAGK